MKKVEYHFDRHIKIERSDAISDLQIWLIQTGIGHQFSKLADKFMFEMKRANRDGVLITSYEGGLESGEIGFLCVHLDGCPHHDKIEPDVVFITCRPPWQPIAKGFADTIVKSWRDQSAKESGDDVEYQKGHW